MEKQLESKTIFKGKVVTLTVDDVLCSNNIKSKREVIHHNGGAAILVVIDNKVLLEKQFRYPFNDYIYEIPAGKLELNEDPKEAAIRELEEETGLIALDIVDLGFMYPSVGYTNEVIKLYLVTNVKEGNLNLDIDEVIDVEYIDIDKVNEMILNNEIVDSKTIVALHKYNLLRK